MSTFEIKGQYNYWYALAKNLTIAFLYPFVLAALLTISEDGRDFGSFLSVLLLFSPWILFIFIYVIYRTRVQIVRLEIQGSFVKVHYFKFNNEHIEDFPMNEVSFVLRRDQSTLYEYFVLEVKLNNLHRVKQFESDGWDKENFFELLDFLDENNIKAEKRIR
jgi:hypothetical protein